MKSSFSRPVPSRASLSEAFVGDEQPVYRLMLLALLMVCCLVLVGGAGNAVVLGLALVFPGVLLFLAPPMRGLSRGFRWGLLALLVWAAVGWLPQGWLPVSGWRVDAVEGYGLQLPYSLTVRPGIAVESWLSLCAGVLWFVCLARLPLNGPGLKRLLFWFSVLFSLLACVVVAGNHIGWRYPGAEGSNAFSFFPNRNQTTNLMLMGGLVGLGYGLHGLRGRSSLNLFGFLCATICLYAMVLGNARAGLLLFFVGVLVLVVLHLRHIRLRWLLGLGVPLGALVLSLMLVSGHQSVDRVVALLADPMSLREGARAEVYADSLQMLRGAPMLGVGLGSFSAVYPQYREVSASFDVIGHPESDLLWWALEAGLVGVLLLGVALVLFVFNCRSLTEGRSGVYRIVLMLALTAFGLHALVDVPGHRVGTVYVALFMAGAVMPRHVQYRSMLSRLQWRMVGLCFAVVGCVWALGPRVGWHVHSQSKRDYLYAQVDSSLVARDLDRAELLIERALRMDPMDWRMYHWRAQLNLIAKGDREAASEDFRRARFVEPTLAVVSLEEGLAWVPYDLGQVISAWRDALYRESEDRERDFERMIRSAKKRPLLWDRLAKLSRVNVALRTRFLAELDQEALVAEMSYDLRHDPSLSEFAAEDRLAFLAKWVIYADAVSVDDYMRNHAVDLPEAWKLWAVHHQSQARFKEAVELVRGSIPMPVLPNVVIDEGQVAKLQRSYQVLPTDLVKGVGLLQFYLKRERYDDALGVIETMSELESPPDYLRYWEGEIHFRKQAYIESWYAFAAYVGL